MRGASSIAWTRIGMDSVATNESPRGKPPPSSATISIVSSPCQSGALDVFQLC